MRQARNGAFWANAFQQTLATAFDKAFAQGISTGSFASAAL
jgi:hypothetical protein